MRRRPVLLLALLLGALFAPACARRTERPNIVVIVIDALRADHLPFYGYPKNTAPFLNRLSQESSVFLHAHSAASWTAPAVGSLLTSLYPFQHRATGGNLADIPREGGKGPLLVSAIAESITTMAEVLKRRGYRTFGMSSNFLISQTCGYAKGFDHFQNFRMKTDGRFLNAKLREWESELRKGPYHLYLHYTDVHVPYRRRAPWYHSGDSRHADIISAYDSNIHYVDAKISALYEWLGWDRNTIIIVTADHGEELWDHGYRGHGRNLFEGTLRVPLLVFLPKGGSIARLITPNVSHVDILPTLCDYLGLKPDLQFEGRSLLPAMKGNSEYLAGRPIYAHVDRGPYRFRAVLRDRWKLIMTAEGDPGWLFNLETDPEEKRNLAMSPREAGRKREMADLYREFESKSRKYEQKLVPLRATPKQLEQLRALGYIR